MRKLLTVLATLAMLSLTNCGYNAIQGNDEQVKSAWSEVLNQYQRRAIYRPYRLCEALKTLRHLREVQFGLSRLRCLSIGGHECARMVRDHHIQGLQLS